MSEVIQKITSIYQNNKDLINFGGIAAALWFITLSSGTRNFLISASEDWVSKHNPVNAIYPAGKDTSNTNKLSLVFGSH